MISLPLLLLFSLAAASGQSPSNAVTAIVGAAVVDGTGGEPVVSTVVIRGSRIDSVGPNVEVPPGARVISAQGQTLLPGLFDLHTHLPYSSVSGMTGDWAKILKAYLYCGVTSVADFGTYGETFEPMRRLLAKGIVTGPRLHLAVRMTTPEGHGAEGGRGDFFSLEVLTPREARAAVKQALRYKPDAIKVFTDGWRYGLDADMTSMDQETLAAIVEEAHGHGMEVLTHTVTLEKAKIAARAGVDVIAHGIGDKAVDPELVRILREKGTTYAPTLAVYEPRDRRQVPALLAAVLEPLAHRLLAMRTPPPPAAPSSAESPRARRWSQLQANTAALREAGIRFGVGTDAGVTGTHHGWATLRELKLLVSAGLTPLEALTAATGNSARALKVDHDRGVIAPGKLADLILVEGEPHREIGAIENVRRVFLGGRELDRKSIAREIASEDQTPIPARTAQPLVDDMERPDGRTALDTLRVNSTESGLHPSRMVFGVVRRDHADKALSVLARMAEKSHPFVRLNFPLSPGAVEPVDARAFRGVRFEARGEGAYRLIVPIRAVRDSGHYAAVFHAGPKWASVTVPFSSLEQKDARAPAPWSAGDLLMLSFEIARPAGELGWLELDNIRFYQ